MAFALIAHNPHDGVIYHHIAHTLGVAWECVVFSAVPDALPVANEAITLVDGVALGRGNIRLKLEEWLAREQPDCVFCDTPWAVKVAHRLGYKTIYHLTEWYPSKKNLRGHAWWVRPMRFAVLSLAFLYACAVCDGILAGEKYKSLAPRLLFPWKKQTVLPYFPAKRWFGDVHPQPLRQNGLAFFYSGPLTAEKGWKRVVRLVTALAERHPERQFELRVLSHDCKNALPDLPPNVVLRLTDELPLVGFCQEVEKSDIGIDLRDDDIENTHCLPIKLFYFMAAGKPALYSDLKAIRKHFPDVAGFDLLVKPDDVAAAVDRVENYMRNPDLYRQHAVLARQAFETRYNWEQIAPVLLDFCEKVTA